MNRLQLIEMHTIQVCKSVNSFLRQNPEFQHLRDDLMAEGYVRLVDTVNRFQKGNVKNLPAYLRLSIRSGLWETVRKDDVIQSPRNCSARQCRENRLSSYPEREEMPTDIDRALFNKICRDPEDRLILALLLSGKSHAQISQEMSEELIIIEAKLKKIGERLEKLLE